MVTQFWSYSEVIKWQKRNPNLADVSQFEGTASNGGIHFFILRLRNQNIKLSTLKLNWISIISSIVLSI
jgi:hypothetical protein